MASIKVNAPSGRIHFFANHPVAGAGGQAEAAVNAGINQFGRGGMFWHQTRRGEGIALAVLDAGILRGLHGFCSNRHLQRSVTQTT